MVIFYVTKRGGSFAFSHTNFTIKQLKKKNKSINYTEVCNEKMIDHIFDVWNHHSPKEDEKVYSFIDMDGKHTGRWITKEEIKNYL